jgi:hypothetical protein
MAPDMSARDEIVVRSVVPVLYAMRLCSLVFFEQVRDAHRAGMTVARDLTVCTQH